MMVKSHLKFAFRNILRSRQFTLLNVIGLSTGLCCVLFIYLWVHDEFQVDRYNEKDARLYQVVQNISTPEGIQTIDNTQGLLAEALSRELPEVEYAASVIPPVWFSKKGLISSDRENIRADAQFVSKDFFHVFTCRFLEGDARGLQSNKYSIALSKELAAKLFHTTNNIVGKTVAFDQEGFNGQYLVSGFFEKNPPNATDQFDILLNYDLFLEKNSKLQRWTNSDPSTFVILKEGADLNEFNRKITGFLKTKNETTKSSLFAQRYSDKYLYNRYENGAPAGGRIEYVKLFSIVAIFILVIACINFMNLSSARASRRTKEIAVKKVVGASRLTLLVQYMAESMAVTCLSLIIALLLALLLLPQFNAITGKSIAISATPNVIFTLLGIAIITGLLAGSYPALYLSGFRPVMILKGHLPSSVSALLARKGLVIFQFAISSILILSVFIVYKQIELVQTKNLGYNRDHLIYFERGGVVPGNKNGKDDGVYEKNMETFLQKIKNIPGVLNAANFRHNITNRHGGTTAVTWPGKDPNNETEFTDIAAGYDFIETLNIQMKEGRTYSRELPSDKSKVVVNEAAVRAMRLEHPVGTTINIWGEDRQIIGVTKDFNFESLYENIKPCFFDFSINPRVSKIMVRIKGGSEGATIERLARFYKDFTGEALDYRFLDDDYQALYASESRVAKLSGYFAGFAIIISCLGLFGLAAFTAQRRQKEIGIRKIVGASVSHVALLLSKEFLKLVLIATMIAAPVALWLLNKWLDNFAYHVRISWFEFALAATVIIAVALFTIGFQVLKVAFANPVKSLRTE